MDKKLIQVGLMGMNKDVINSKTAQQQAYEIKNFRLSATQDSNAFELTTERGTKSIPLEWTDSNDNQIQVQGTIIGYCILNNYLVLFTFDHQRTADRIYRLTLNPDEFEEGITEIVLLYEGDKLEFDTNHLIDAIPYYETELIQKVYWIDGKNQPRVINIVSDGDIHTASYHLVDYDPYGFIQEIYSDYNPIQVTKSYVGGMFHAGVIQYAYSFFNENAQETPVIDVTPLYYIAREDRGEKPDTRVGCTFTLSLEIPEDFLKKFDYVRFYSIYRSSLDTTPLVKVINEIEINNPNATESKTYNFIDDNTQGYVYDAQQLLIRNNKIIPQTFNYKDGKLFFGNFKNEINLTDIEDTVFNTIDISWERSKVIEISPNEQSTISGYENEIVPSEFNVYNYKSQLQHNSQEIKTFKGNEYYHLGVQLQDKYGNWSQPYYVKTSKNTVFPKGSFYHYNYGGEIHNSFIYPIYKVAQAETDDNINTIINDLGIDTSDYIRIRPVVSFPTASERAILCQGIVNPTVFNLGQRVNGTCHAQASWFFRPYPNDRFQENNGVYTHLRGLAQVQWDNYAPLFNTRYLNGEIQCMYSSIDNTFVNNTTIEVPSTSFSLDDTYSWDNSSNPLFQNISEYKAKQMRLLASSEHYEYPYNSGDYYDYYYNIHEDDDYIEHPEYQSTLTDGQTHTFYAKLKTEPIPNATDVEGYKYTVEVIREIEYLNGDYRVVPHGEYTYYVSSTGESWNISEEVKLPEVRVRPYAYSIDEKHRSLYDSYYFVDTQICTLNSPDIEFDTNIQNTDTNEYGLSLVGSSRFTSNVGKYNIIAQNPNFLNDVNIKSNKYIRSTKLATGFNTEKYQTGAQESGQYLSSGGTIVSALDCWYDDACNLFTRDEDTYVWNEESYQNSYVVYPWQRKYLNNFNNNQSLIEIPSDDYGITTESGEPSLIIKKILGNLRFCYTDYCTNQENMDIDYLKLFNSQEAQLLKTAENKLYCGNVDQLVTCNSEYLGKGVEQLYDGNPYEMIQWKVYGSQGGFPPLTGYPLMLGHSGTIGDATRFQGDANYNFEYFGENSEPADTKHPYFRHISPNNRSTDPIWIRYKSSPHFVFKFSDGDVLPILSSSSETPTSLTYDTLWGTETINSPKYLNKESVTISMKQSYLWIADIYNPKKENTPLSDFELLNRVWLPCGESKPLDSTDKLVWSEGDTFFQRYDCLKTYPFSNDDYQSVVEIGSFMLETRVNLDGRYDTNRGLMDNTAVTKENFNLINPVYSQMNNFFQYKMLDERFNNKDTEYKNRITWTLDKQNGDDVDQWTRVTELGILDLDGDKGKVTKIERFDNNLYIFQDKGIARLNYNDNIQIPTEGNIPIEVVNSGFINGKRYISENQGLQDKWCSKSTPYGIFFKDGYSKALCTVKHDERRNPVVAPLSQGSMQKWTEQNVEDIYKVNYDNQVNEVLFMIQNNLDYSALAYSPLYQAFTAFYDYKDWITNYNNSTISLLKANSYPNMQYIYFVRRATNTNNKPIFNCFYNEEEVKPYWIKFTSVVDNYDCIFDNIYLKSNLYAYDKNSMNDEDIDITLKGDDIYQGDSVFPFDLISVSNDKQAYELENTFANVWKEFKPIKKFGVWRGRIPRTNSINGKYLGSRIRNHWTRIGLKKENPSTEKTVVRDIKVDVFF